MKFASPYCGASTLLFPRVKLARTRNANGGSTITATIASSTQTAVSLDRNRVMRWSAWPDERGRAMTVSLTGRGPALRPHLQERFVGGLSASQPPTHEIVLIDLHPALILSDIIGAIG